MVTPNWGKQTTPLEDKKEKKSKKKNTKESEE